VTPTRVILSVLDADGAGGWGGWEVDDAGGLFSFHAWIAGDEIFSWEATCDPAADGERPCWQGAAVTLNGALAMLAEHVCGAHGGAR
jgi:hypothetical protein